MSLNSSDEQMGGAVLLRPLSFTFLTAFACASAAVLFGFLFLGEYTKRVQVNGVLVPDSGLVALVGPQSGEIVERRAVEGQAVKTGDVLFVITSESFSDLNAPRSIFGTNAAILETLERRKTSLNKEFGEAEQLNLQKHEQVNQKIADLQDQIGRLDKQIEIQNGRVSVAQTKYGLFLKLGEKAEVSPLAVLQNKDELLERQETTLTLERERFALKGELVAARGEAKQLVTQGRLGETQLEQQFAEMDQQRVVAQTKQRILIRAPRNGTVTAMLAEPGQTVNGRTLLTILPAESKLTAQLYVPSRSAGFLAVGQRVLIRYAAYPYQRFGQYDGVVTRVSRTAVPSSDLPPLIGVTNTKSGEGFYQVRVALRSQDVTAYGRQIPLRAGMLLDADIIEKTHKLVDWIFEPLQSSRG